MNAHSYSNLLWPPDDYAANKVLCIEFANTVSWRGKTNSTDHLTSVQAWFDWLLENQALPASVLTDLKQKAGIDPEEALAAFERAIELREAVYSLLSGYSRNEDPPAKDRMLVQEVLARAIAKLRFVLSGGHWTFELGASQGWEATLYGPALSSAQLLTSPYAEKVKPCGRDECRWLFIDLTKNHSRKWCDMASCGNVEKARASYGRKRGIGTIPK